jgi:ribosomal protein S18 acetylase RimI-like enzyme
LHLREATLEDLPLLASLNHQLIEDQRSSNPMSVAELQERMRGWLAAEYRAVVFEIESEPVAYAVFRPAEAGIHLLQFFVARGLRRRGIGRRAIEAFRKRHVPPRATLTLEVLAHNRTALAFWRALGFEEHALQLRLSPPAGGAEQPAVASWSEFEQAAPDFGAAARRLLIGPDGVAIGFLASVGAPGAPHLSPVCPIFCGDHLYLSAGAHTPKAADLRARGNYVLHALLAANDEEFQLAGRAFEVHDAGERTAVHAAIPFAAFGTSDPIFRLSIERALWVYWERVGQPDTKAVRKRWPGLGT